jgi:hypothetical protein
MVQIWSRPFRVLPNAILEPSGELGAGQGRDHR